MTAPVTYRAATAGELPFVFHSWLRSFQGTHYAGPLPDDLYYEAYHTAIERLLARPGVRVLCAVDAGAEPGERALFGYLVIEPATTGQPFQAVVHYAYVKEPFRRNGVFKSLLTAAGVKPTGPLAYTFRTPIAGRLAGAGGPFPAAVFAPKLARKAPTPAAADAAPPPSKEAHP